MNVGSVIRNVFYAIMHPVETMKDLFRRVVGRGEGARPRVGEAGMAQVPDRRGRDVLDISPKSVVRNLANNREINEQVKAMSTEDLSALIDYMVEAKDEHIVDVLNSKSRPWEYGIMFSKDSMTPEVAGKLLGFMIDKAAQEGKSSRAGQCIRFSVVSFYSSLMFERGVLNREEWIVPMLKYLLPLMTENIERRPETAAVYKRYLQEQSELVTIDMHDFTVEEVGMFRAIWTHKPEAEEEGPVQPVVAAGMAQVPDRRGRDVEKAALGPAGMLQNVNDTIRTGRNYHDMQVPGTVPDMDAFIDYMVTNSAANTVDILADHTRLWSFGVIARSRAVFTSETAKKLLDFMINKKAQEGFSREENRCVPFDAVRSFSEMMFMDKILSREEWIVPMLKYLLPLMTENIERRPETAAVYQRYLQEQSGFVTIDMHDFTAKEAEMFGAIWTHKPEAEEEGPVQPVAEAEVAVPAVRDVEVQRRPQEVDDEFMAQIQRGDRSIRDRIPSLGNLPFHELVDHLVTDPSCNTVDALNASRHLSRALKGHSVWTPDLAEQLLGFIISPEKQVGFSESGNARVNADVVNRIANHAFDTGMLKREEWEDRIRAYLNAGE